jgi:hypothetical protein
MFDKVLILDVGGRMAFYGPPAECVAYFCGQADGEGEGGICPACGNLNAETVFTVLEDCAETIDAEGRAVTRRKRSPDDWKLLFQLYRKGKAADAASVVAAGELPSGPARTPRVRISRLGTMIRRVFTEKLKDPMQLVLVFLAPLVLGLAMAGLMRGGEMPYAYARNEDAPKYFFLSIIIFIFFGLMASIGEVIKDRAKLLRERLLDLGGLAYVLSKTLPFLVFNLFQVCIYCLIGQWLLAIPGFGGSPLPALGLLPFPVFFILTGMLASWASFVLGLLISSMLRSQAAAFAIIPLIIIPQILFGGVFLPFDRMGKFEHEKVPFYANLTVSRWSYEALIAGDRMLNPVYVLQDSDNNAPLIRRLNADPKTAVSAVMQALKRESLLTAAPAAISVDFFDGVLTGRGVPAADTTRIKGLYAAAPRSGLYRLKDDASPADREWIVAFLTGLRPNGLFNRYDAEQNNLALDQDFRAVSVDWAEVWDAARRGGAEAGWTSWLPSSNPFPAVNKVVGPFLVGTLLYNDLVLLLMVQFLSGLAVFAIGRQQR